MTGEHPRPRTDKRRGPVPAARGVLRAIDARTRPNLKRAVPAAVIALISYALGQHLGGIGRSTPAPFDAFGATVEVPAGYVTLLVIALTVIFVVAGVIASRAAARELATLVQSRGGLAAASAIRLICHLLGFAVTGLGVLALLQVNLSGLLVGGAVTAVVLGIAAQQTLGNFFAGLVLLFARPYTPGQRVTVHSGALGGPFEGVIVGAGLTYTTMETSQGTISLPNSGLLAAAIGPAPEPDPGHPPST
jgi:small-conductance mechanosensitive channel